MQSFVRKFRSIWGSDRADRQCDRPHHHRLHQKCNGLTQPRSGLSGKITSSLLSLTTLLAHPVTLGCSLVTATTLVGLVGSIESAQAQAVTPFTCDSAFYQVRVTGTVATPTAEIFKIDRTTYPWAMPTTPFKSINNAMIRSLAYNSQDNFLYAIQTKSNNLIKIDTNGNTQTVPITGLPSLIQNVSAFTFDLSGNAYLWDNTKGQLYTFKVTASATTYAATTIGPAQGITTYDIGDLAFDPLDGKLYGTNNQTPINLVKINPADGTILPIGPLNISTSGSSFGSLFFDPHIGATGSLYTYNNLGNFYEIDTSTGTATLSSLANQTNSLGSDGASCLAFNSKTLISISGTVFNDLDKNKLQNTTAPTEGGTNAGGLNVAIVNSANIVKGTATVLSNGTYSASIVPVNGLYTVLITTQPVVINSAPPAVTLPSNWVSTGENLNGTVEIVNAPTTVVDGKQIIGVGVVDIPGVNFGIKKLAVSGKVWNDADADLTINNSETGTNAGSSTLTVYAFNPTTGNIVDKALVNNTTGIYTLSNVPLNTSGLKLRLSNDSTGIVDNTAPTSPSLPSTWFNTGENLNGTKDSVVSTLGDIALSTATTDIINQNFGIKQLAVSGNVWNDADADLTINSGELGTNAGSSTLTVYAFNPTTGKVVDKALVDSNGIYTIVGIPPNTSGYKLRLSNDNTVAVGGTAPTSPSIPTSWFNTGESRNGTIDYDITTLGDINVSTGAATANVPNQNFGVRQSYSIAPTPAPTTCTPNFQTSINTGIDANGQQLPFDAPTARSYDRHWTAEWIAGPASGPYTPYATPRPVGVMPAVVIDNLAPGAWVNAPSNALWISYPFRLAPNPLYPNSNGNHQDANLDGIAGPSEYKDTVRVKYTTTLNLPTNTNTISVSVPVKVSVDNQFVSAKVNGVENFTTDPAKNAYSEDYRSRQPFDLSNGWQPGTNTIEIITDSGPDRTGFYLAIDVSTTSTPICGKANLQLVKRITGVKPAGGTFTSFDPTIESPQPTSFPANYVKGKNNGGVVKPGDEIEYTIYYVNNGGNPAKSVKICDLLKPDLLFNPDGFAPGLGIKLQLDTQPSQLLTSINDNNSVDRAQYIDGAPPASLTGCNLPIPHTAADTSGTVVIDLTSASASDSTLPVLQTLPGASGSLIPNNSYGFFKFRAKMK